MLSRIFSKLFVIEHWQIGRLDDFDLQSSIQQQWRSVRWLQSPHILADPFCWREQGLTVFAELVKPWSGKGVIAVLRAPAGSDELAPPSVVIEQPQHLSYPSIVRDNGATYLACECHESFGIPLFEAVDFPLRWRRCSTVLDGIPAVDPTFYRHGGKWWVLFARQDDQPEQNLYVAHAPTLRGKWTMHGRNPVKRSRVSSRPAGGIFSDDSGRLYRFSQNCQRHYGAGLTLNRIDALNEERYEETELYTFVPSEHSTGEQGAHTANLNGGVCMLDRSIGTAHPLNVARKSLWLARRTLAHRRKS